MALTCTRFIPDNIPLYGDLYEWVGKITFDASYPTGGEPFSAVTDLGFNTGAAIVFVGVESQSGVLTKHVRWDRANGTLFIAIEDAISGIEAQAGSTTDQSAVFFNARIIVRARDAY